MTHALCTAVLLAALLAAAAPAFGQRQGGGAGLDVGAAAVAATATDAAGTEAQAVALRALVRDAIGRNRRLAAALLRLAFHDSFTQDGGVGGCNGSIRFELGRKDNRGLAGAVRQLERFQRRTGLGWGDCVAIAGAEAIDAAGGPSIPLRLGRRSASAADPDGGLPNKENSLAQLRVQFAARGLSERDLVALSGAHTLGRNEGRPFVRESSRFQNDYFVNLEWFVKKETGEVSGRRPPDRPNNQLQSDLALISENSARNVVLEFAVSESAFFAAFVSAYQKLTDTGF